MIAPRFLGIDGGGTHLRVVIVDRDMNPLASVTQGNVNPSTIGRLAAQARIRQAVTRALHQTGLEPSAIAAAGIGIAGASAEHSRPWLLRTLESALPESLLIPSSDLEIALAGALAQRTGILLLAGTGSAVYGVAPDGTRLQIGGWGYLLGDEGSSFWIGAQLLRQITRRHDEALGPERRALEHACLDTLGLQEPRDLVRWVYRAEEPPVARVASLAKLVLDLAAAGERQARDILCAAAKHLSLQVDVMQRRLDYPGAPIAFAGGLLDHDNPLAADVARRLGLSERPRARFQPVIGAALLAKEEWSAKA